MKSLAVGEPFAHSIGTSASWSSVAMTKWKPKSIRAPASVTDLMSSSTGS